MRIKSERCMPVMNRLTPALFLDRDGVVNREIGYLYKSEHVDFVPGIFELCRSAQALHYKIIILTNQAGIGRELYTEADLHSLMEWMTAQFERERVSLDDYYYCPHHPEQAIGRYRIDCPDRKPRPGMLLRASREHGIDLSQSLLVGDRCSDMQAGAAAGVGKLVLLAGTEVATCEVATHFTVVKTLEEVICMIGK